MAAARGRIRRSGALHATEDPHFVASMFETELTLRVWDVVQALTHAKTLSPGLTPMVRSRRKIASSDT